MTDPEATPPSKITPEFQAYFPENGAVTEYVKWAVETTHAPKTFHLGSILSILAYDACRRGFTYGNHESFKLNLVLIGPSGSAKSTAKKRALDFMRDWYARIGLAYPGIMAQGSRSGLLHAMKAHRMAHPNHHIGGHITPIMLHLDELSALLRQRDITEMVNMLYDGGDFQINERQFQKMVEEAARTGAFTDDTDFVIKQPRLFSIFCTTPIALEMITSEDQAHGGLFGRYLWLRERVNVDEMQPEIRRYPFWRKSVMDGFVQLDAWLKRAYDVHPFPSKNITITDKSHDLKKEIWDWYKRCMALGTPMAGMASRLYVMVDQIAALYAYSMGTNHADEEAVWRANNFVLHCLQSVDVVLGEVGGSATFRLMNKLEALVRAAGSEGVNRRDAYRVLRVGKPELDPALEGLQNAGLVTLINTNLGQPGRPKIVIIHYDCIKEPKPPNDTETIH